MTFRRRSSELKARDREVEALEAELSDLIATARDIMNRVCVKVEQRAAQRPEDGRA